MNVRSQPTHLPSEATTPRWQRWPLKVSTMLMLVALALALMVHATPTAHAFPIESTCVVGWGEDSYGQATPPAGLTDVVAVSAGFFHSLALKADGTLVGWGNDSSGQATPPAGLSDVTAISGGGGHSLALKADGTVVGWGHNDDGQATPPAGLTDVVAVSAGFAHSLALKGDGTVVGWGHNDDGQATPPAGLTDVVAIAAGALHSLALKADGTVVGWGDNTIGEATPPAGLSDVVAIDAAGYIGSHIHYSLALKADGTVVGWGVNSLGQTTPPTGLSNVVAISAGFTHALALKGDGTVVGWGDNAVGQLTPPASLSSALAISAGGAHNLAMTSACASPNTPPTVAADNANVTVDEGQTATNTGTVGDVDGDTVTLTASVGTVVNNNDGTWSWSYPTGSTADSQTVTITADDGNGGTAQTTFDLTVNALPINARINGTDCNLIDAITAANTDTATGACAAGTPGADTIELLDNVTLVNTIGFAGLPQITSEITIEGAGFTIARDAGAPNFGVISVATSGNLTLNDTTISGGNTSGGGISNYGALTLNNSTISDNLVPHDGGTTLGGGITNEGKATINNSTISGNSARIGGGIYNSSTGTVLLNNSTISDNLAGSSGGGIYSQSASSSSGTVTANNSTFSGNSASSGGGMVNRGTLTLNDSTFSGNIATAEGGGIFNDYGTIVTLARTLIAGNTAPSGQEISNTANSPVNADNFNLFGHSGQSNAQAFSNFTPGASDITATSDGTAPTALAAILDTTLQNNGGDTETHALVAGSPAIDAAPSGPHTDQRGVARPQGCNFDIGSYELEQEPCVVNEPPIADAGPDQTVTLPADASLSGSVSDDGMPDPPAAVTVAWSQVSGPGTVTFADATSATTTASFSVDGTYVLRLTADDGDLTAADEVTITVEPVEPVLLTDSVTQESITAVYNPQPTACANEPAPGLPIHTITPTLANSHATNSYSDLYFVLTELAYTNEQGGEQPTLCNADGGNGGQVGARLTLPLEGDLADNDFGPGEEFTIDLEVGLPVAAQYNFFADLYGTPVYAAAAQSSGLHQIGTMALTFDENGTLIDFDVHIFLPHVVQ